LLPVVVVIFGLTTLSDCVPPSFPIAEIAPIGVAAFEPFTTIIDITSESAADRLIVTVCPGPTTGSREYHTCVHRSSPIVVLVGPAAVIHPFPKLSVGVIVTPRCDEAHITSKSPPVLLNAAVVCDGCDVALIYPCVATTTGPGAPPVAVRFPGGVGVGIPVPCVVAVAVLEYALKLFAVSLALTR
jgi:hypothetical protein